MIVIAMGVCGTGKPSLVSCYQSVWLVSFLMAIRFIPLQIKAR